MSKTLAIFCAIIALAIPAALAAEAPGPKMIGSSSTYIEQNWTLDFGDSIPAYFNVKVFGFPAAWFQNPRVQSGNGAALVEESDSMGNKVLEFRIAPSKRREVITLRAFVETDYSKQNPVADLPLEYYSESTPLTKSDDEMAAVAGQLTSGSSDDLEKLVRITSFVHNRVNYDGAGYGGTIENASRAYYNKSGTCDEYSHLTVSLLRAIGIPSKFVAGFVCSENCSRQENWGPHAWVEAYSDARWVPLDPTFNEAFVLDATHIKFAEGRDQGDVKEQFTAPPNYPISTAIARLQRNYSVTIDEWKPFEKSFELYVPDSNATVGENSLETISVRASNPGSLPLAVPLALNAPKELNVSPSSDELLYLLPGQSKEVNWSVLTPAQLQEGYVYKYSLDVSSLGVSQKTQLTARKGGQSRVIERLQVLEIKPEWSSDRSSFKLVFLIQNTGNKGAAVRAVLDAPSGTQEQRFAIQQGGLRALSFLLSADAMPQNVLEGTLVLEAEGQQLSQPFSITLREATVPPAQVKQKLAAGFQLEEWAPYAAGAIIIILALALVLLRKR